MSKSYTLDKLHEALEAVRRKDDAAAQGAILDLIKKHELIMQNFELQKEYGNGTDTRTERETP